MARMLGRSTWDLRTFKREWDVRNGREKFMSYIDALEWTYRRDIDTIKSWDYILLKEAARCLKNIISPRNERLAGTAALEHL